MRAFMVIVALFAFCGEANAQTYQFENDMPYVGVICTDEDTARTLGEIYGERGRAGFVDSARALVVTGNCRAFFRPYRLAQDVPTEVLQTWAYGVETLTLTRSRMGKEDIFGFFPSPGV